MTDTTNIAALREQNRAELERLRADMIAREIDTAAAEHPSSRWRRAATARKEQHERQRERDARRQEARMVRKVAAIGDDIDARIAAAIETLRTEERTRLRDVVIGVVAHLRAELDALHETLRTARVETADLRGEIERLRRPIVSEGKPDLRAVN